MVSADQFRQLALQLPGTAELPHFNKASFRINKKIFATLDAVKLQASVKLNDVDQDVFSLAGRGIIYPVPNKWGKQGWTIVELQHVDIAHVTDILTTAYKYVAGK